MGFHIIVSIEFSLVLHKKFLAWNTKENVNIMKLPSTCYQQINQNKDVAQNLFFSYVKKKKKEKKKKKIFVKAKRWGGQKLFIVTEIEIDEADFLELVSILIRIPKKFKQEKKRHNIYWDDCFLM